MDAPKLTQLITCSSCQNELEVIQLSPLMLDWIFEYDQDPAPPDSELDASGGGSI
ncbi:MAG: hypothetical protein ACI85U_001551 [Candidatus Promineifilaceae bacterium]|jgi:hypothetical protein